VVILRAIYLFCLVLTFTSTTFANSNDSQTPFTDVRATLETAYYRDDVAKLNEIVDLLTPDATHTNDWHILYNTAFAHYHLANILSDTDTRTAKEHADRAIEYLKRADAIDPDNVEIVALLGAAHGRRAGFGAIASLRYGRASMRESARAVSLDSTNSRALIVRGQTLMYAPALFGGSVEEAQRLLNAAVGAAAREPNSDSLIVEWGGAADAHAFLALLELCAGNPAEAHRHASLALELRPDYHYVREWILPRIADKADSGDHHE